VIVFFRFFYLLLLSCVFFVVFPFFVRVFELRV